MKKKNEISKSADSQSEFMNNKTTIDYHKSIENSDGKEMYQNSELNQYIKIEELK